MFFTTSGMYNKIFPDEWKECTDCKFLDCVRVAPRKNDGKAGTGKLEQNIFDEINLYLNTKNAYDDHAIIFIYLLYILPGIQLN
jgi:hypothetical protein